MTSNECPRFHTCNASLCPLGQDSSHTGHHAGGDKVCYYLRMSKKSGADERFADDPTFTACQENLSVVIERYPSIGKAVAQAARKGFPGANLVRRNTAEKAVSNPVPPVGCP